MLDIPDDSEDDYDSDGDEDYNPLDKDTQSIKSDDNASVSEMDVDSDSSEPSSCTSC